MLDLLIKNARICDGTGAPSFMGESRGEGRASSALVGTTNGQTAERVLDADGLVLAPGFVDPHTHYDAQIAWDPLLTCSPWHGVTTVVMGNCGVGVAPVKPETREILMQDLVNVEAIPYDVMKAGIDWQWESYGQYLDAVGPPRARHQRGRAGRVHAAAPLRDGRGVVRAGRRPGDEIATMRRLLREAMEAGAFGFTTTTSRNHVGYQGRPLACRNASREELVGVVRGLADVGRGAIEIILNSGGMYAVSDEDVELLRQITQASGRPVTWLALFAHPGQPDFHDQTFAKLGDLVKQAIPQVTPRPIMSQGDLQEPDHVRLVRVLAEGVQPPGGRADRALPGSRVPRGLPAGAGEPQAQPHVGPDARAGGGPARAGGPRRPHPRGDRGEPGQAAGGRLLRPGPGRRPRRRASSPPRSTSIPRASSGSSPTTAA